MNKEQVFETLAAAQGRVNSKELPLGVRIRSKETVALCEERIRSEGWAADGKSPAFYEGYGAFKFGEPLANCPRVADTTMSADWRMGWITARDDERDSRVA